MGRIVRRATVEDIEQMIYDAMYETFLKNPNISLEENKQLYAAERQKLLGVPPFQEKGWRGDWT